VDGSEDRFFIGSEKIQSSGIGFDLVPVSGSVCSVCVLDRRTDVWIDRWAMAYSMLCVYAVAR